MSSHDIADKPGRPGIPCLHCLVRDAILDDILIDDNTTRGEQAFAIGQALGDVIVMGREIGKGDATLILEASQTIIRFTQGLQRAISADPGTMDDLIRRLSE